MPHEKITYLTDPDFLVLAEVEDRGRGHRISVEVAYGFAARRGRTGKLVLCEGIHEKQLVFEASSLQIVPFRRAHPADTQQPGSHPRTAYRPRSSLVR